MSHAVTIPAIEKGKRAGAGQRAIEAIRGHEVLSASVCMLVFAAVMVYRTLSRPLWFDETFTLFISRLSRLSDMLRAMPADSQPPLQYFLTHVSIRLLGETEFALRLPEMTAYLLAGFLVYRIVRRHGSAVQALFAMAALLGCSLNIWQETTARPYGLLVCSTGLVFFSWQSATLKEGRRGPALAGVTLGLAVGVASHHLAVVDIGLFLLAGEITRLRVRRRLDPAVLVAVLAGLAPLVWTVPLARQTQHLLGDPVQHAVRFWTQPSFENLAAYRWMTPLMLLLFTALWAVAALKGSGSRDQGSEIQGPRDRRTRGPAEPEGRVPAWERAAAAMLCLVLPVQLLLTSFEHGYFFPKYAVNTTVGLALLAGWGLPWIPGLRKVAQGAMALGAICFVAYMALAAVAANSREPMGRARMAATAVSGLVAGAPGEDPIVLANAYDFTSEWWYAPAGLRKRLVYLCDTSYAVRQTDFVPELSLAADRDLIPAPIEDFTSFTGAHAHFLLFSSGLERLDMAKKRLNETGWKLTRIGQSGTDELYQVDRGN